MLQENEILKIAIKWMTESFRKFKAQAQSGETLLHGGSGGSESNFKTASES